MNRRLTCEWEDKDGGCWNFLLNGLCIVLAATSLELVQLRQPRKSSCTPSLYDVTMGRQNTSSLAPLLAAGAAQTLLHVSCKIGADTAMLMLSLPCPAPSAREPAGRAFASAFVCRALSSRLLASLQAAPGLCL